MNIGDISSPDFTRDLPPNGYPQAADDVTVLQDLLKKLINEAGQSVVLFGHSSGGFTATEAATPKLQMKNRRENGMPGGIVGISYGCAFLIPVGESVHSFF